MKKGFVTIFVIVAIVIVAGILIFTNSGEVTSDNNGDNNDAGNTGSTGGTGTGSGSGPGSSGVAPRTPDEYTVEITENGFSPSSLTIFRGDRVKFVNIGSSPSWPASAVHPTHKVYPGSNIEKCGTVEENLIFDACEGLAPGEDYTFEFNEIGTWSYHDHLHANLRGTIVVESIVN